MTIGNLLKKIDRLEKLIQKQDFNLNLCQKRIQRLEEQVEEYKNGQIVREEKVNTARQDFIDLCKKHNISVYVATGRCRKRNLVNDRYKLAREMIELGHSATVIGRVMGRDHTTILSLLKRGVKE